MKSTERIIRVGVFTKPLDNWTSGSGHHLDELMKHVLDQNDGTFEFTFIHYRKSCNPIYKRVHELIVKRNPFSAGRMLSKQKFDIIHYSPLTVFAPVWNIKAKKTATVHGVEEAIYPQGYSFLQRFHEAKILPIYMRMMDAVATVSETSKQYFIDHYKVDKNKIFITTNGLGSIYRILAGDENKLPPDLNITRPFVLHISRYSMRKNPVAIIRGFARFIEISKMDFQLVCAGKGWNCPDVEKLAKKEGILQRLVTPGFVSDEISVKLLNNADVFLFPSFAEGFGMPNIEAMACGCPVITSNIFAIPEVVGNAACILSKPDDELETANAIAKIINDAEYKKALVVRGLERVKRYNWKDSAEALLARWKELG